MSQQERLPVMPVPPDCYSVISIEMTSPSEPGTYQSKWRMCTSSGSFFGGTSFFYLNRYLVFREETLPNWLFPLSVGSSIDLLLSFKFITLFVSLMTTL